MNDAQILAHELLTKSRFYTTAADHSLRLIQTFQAGKQPGETTFFKTLDDHLRLRPGFLYCFTGWPGGGKTEFLTQLSVLQAKFKKRKVAFYSPESYPVDEFVDTFIHSYLGKTTDRRFPKVCSEAEYLHGVEWCNKHFYFCDWEETPDVQTLINSFGYLADQGCEIFVVDPFNSIVSEGEDRNIAVALKKNLTAFKRFAVQRRVQVWLVEHPNTPKEKKDYDVCPNNRNLFGGTMWWNKIDVGCTIHRPNREDKTDKSVWIDVWKVKRQQLNGIPGTATLYYDLAAGRYFEDQYCLDHPMSEKDLYAEKEQQPF